MKENMEISGGWFTKVLAMAVKLAVVALIFFVVCWAVGFSLDDFLSASPIDKLILLFVLFIWSK